MTAISPPHAAVVTHHVVASPVGPLTLVAHDSLLAGCYMDGQRHRPDTTTLPAADPGASGPAPDAPQGADRGVFGRADPAAFGEVVRQLEAYFAGRLTVFDLPLHQVGTEFQRRVWAELVRIPYGQTISYGELARRLGQPGAARAVGLANGRNPIGIIVPCHRVIGATGALTGYGGGTERKRQLLELEQHRVAPDLWSAAAR